MYCVESENGNLRCVECEPIGKTYANHAEAKRAREAKAKAKREAIKAYLYKASLVAAGALGACLCIYGATL